VTLYASEIFCHGGINYRIFIFHTGRPIDIYKKRQFLAVSKKNFFQAFNLCVINFLIKYLQYWRNVITVSLSGLENSKNFGTFVF